MKTFIQLLSLVLLLQANTSQANELGHTEADSCSAEKCLNLTASSNSNNAGKLGSYFLDKKLALTLSQGVTKKIKSQDTTQ